MPNRIIRESITTSESIDCLTAEEERFFCRLITYVDDFGRGDGRAKILLARNFPLKLDQIKVIDIEKWMDSLERTNHIRRYIVDDNPYFYFVNWEKHQTVRNKRSKFPEPVINLKTIENNCDQLNVNTNKCPRYPIQSESESVSISESELNKNSPSFRNDNQEFELNGSPESNLSPKPKPSGPYKEIVDMFNSTCTELPRVIKLTPGRRQKILVSYNNFFDKDIEKIKEFFDKVKRSDFLCGKNSKWRANFDWLINMTNSMRVLEGNYDNRAGEQPQEKEELTFEERAAKRETDYQKNRDASYKTFEQLGIKPKFSKSDEELEEFMNGLSEEEKKEIGWDE